MGSQEFGKVFPDVEFDFFPVIEPGAADGFFVEGEAKWSDEVEG